MAGNGSRERDAGAPAGAFARRTMAGLAGLARRVAFAVAVLFGVSAILSAGALAAHLAGLDASTLVAAPAWLAYAAGILLVLWFLAALLGMLGIAILCIFGFLALAAVLFPATDWRCEG